MICDKCGHKEEIIKSISSEFPTNCPSCKSKKYRQNFETRFGNANIVIDYCGVPKTISQQGERNYKKMSSDEKERVDNKYKPKKPKKKPLWERMKDWKL